MDTIEQLTQNKTLEAITSRKSIRGFLPDAIPTELLHTLLKAASRAPSGSNIQPWKVHVVSGQARNALSAALLEAFNSNTPNQCEYQYYPKEWREPYLARRRENGWSLYNILGIQKGDKQAMQRQHARNFEFFDAPVVLFITLDKDMEQGSWLDTGMFIQNIMIAARALGLHTCPQVALVNYPAIVKQQLSIPADQILVCGISLGYEDTSNPANKLQTPRVPLEEFVSFHE
ncbi:nitroreductase [Advenella sp. RU8]|uniref:nitroreductase n=1 Tax=Advenella sp. RU8 TaxID=3399575 RepID=UPI003AB07D5F